MASKRKPKRCVGNHKKVYVATVVNRLTGKKVEHYICERCEKEFKKYVK